MVIYFRKMTLGWVLSTLPFLLFFIAVGYFCLKSVRLPPNWKISHLILLIICVIVYCSALWFCASNMWVSVCHEFDEKIITKHSFLGFSWTQIKTRNDVEKLRIVERSSLPFGSTHYLLQIVFKNGAIEPVCAADNIADLQKVQNQLGIASLEKQ